MVETVPLVVRLCFVLRVQFHEREERTFRKHCSPLLCYHAARGGALLTRQHATIVDESVTIRCAAPAQQEDTVVLQPVLPRAAFVPTAARRWRQTLTTLSRSVRPQPPRPSRRTYFS